MSLYLVDMPGLNQNQRAVMQRIVEQARIDDLLAIFDKLDLQTRAEVLEAISKKLNIAAKNFHLTNIKTFIQASDVEIKNWLITAVAESYAEGGNIMYSDLKKLSVTPEHPKAVVTKWTADKIRQIDLLSIQKDAVNALISEAYLDFANGMNGLVKGAERMLNETIKRQVRAQIITGQITGSATREIAKEVESVIGSQGFSVLIDRGGNSWTLKQYAEMLSRTHIIKSVNEGVIARGIEFGVDTLQCSTHPGACPICIPFEGRLFSMSGENKKIPSVGEFPNPIHPFCRHRLLPRPDLDPVDND